MKHDFTNPELTQHATESADSYRIYGRIEDAAAPVIISSPHSGVEYPDDFHYACSLSKLRKLEDSYIDELSQSAIDLNIPMITARIPRSYLDLNRAANAIDPLQTSSGLSILDGDPDDKNVSRGSGLFATVSQLRKFNIFENADELPSEAELNRRLMTYYYPYHGKLTDMILRMKERFGKVFLIDMHSCDTVGTIDRDDLSKMGERPDIIISNDFNQRSGAAFADALTQEFEKYGLTVWRDNPFLGGHITRQYGRPEQNIESIQIEVTKKYMDENDFTKAESFEKMKAILGMVFEKASRHALDHIPATRQKHQPRLPDILEPAA